MLSSLYVWFLVCNVEEKRIKRAVLCGLFSIRYSIKLRKKKKKKKMENNEMLLSSISVLSEW